MSLEMEVNGATIERCGDKLADFIRHDAYGEYDRTGILAEPRPDVISREQLRVMNSAMRARSKVDAWLPFLGRALPELAQVPTSVDLVDSHEGEVENALGHLRAAVESLCVPWISDMGATKILYLKRPKLVAISDSYIRQRLEVRLTPGPERAIAVARAVREVGIRNARALMELKRISDGITDPAVPLSKARIVDILVWVEEARAQGHKFWNKRYPMQQPQT